MNKIKTENQKLKAIVRVLEVIVALLIVLLIPISMLYLFAFILFYRELYVDVMMLLMFFSIVPMGLFFVYRIVTSIVKVLRMLNPDVRKLKDES